MSTDFIKFHQIPSSIKEIVQFDEEELTEAKIAAKSKQISARGDTVLFIHGSPAAELLGTRSSE